MSPGAEHHFDAAAPSSEESAHVRFSFWCEDVLDTFHVRSLGATEQLNTPYVVELELTAAAEGADATDLLGRDARVSIERSAHARAFCGVVSRVEILDDGGTYQSSRLEVRPALHGLRLTRNTRIFQEKTGLEIVTEVLSTGLGSYGRELDAQRVHAGRYHRRDYCVQYCETDLDFVHRLLEEEGIGYYFDFEGERERLILFDRPSALDHVRTFDDGAVQYHQVLRGAGAESIRRFEPIRQLASTRVTVRDHDWARGRPRIEQTARASSDIVSPHEREHEVYDHGLQRSVTISEDRELLSTAVELARSAVVPAVVPVGYDHLVRDLPGVLLDAFTSNDAEHQAAIRRDQVRRDASVVQGASSVIGFSPGNTFQVLGHPTLSGDEEYYLTRVVHRGGNAISREGEQELELTYENEFTCLEASVEWRPERRARKPRIHGVQTATVTGPAGTDVHTDQHGRVKVRFNWDRSPEDPAGNYTCWIRTGQAWAGHGAPGFLFIPRVGMEVVVAFVDGDPDRPLVTGCVYNGRNPTPALLPYQATKSIIRTRSIPHGAGYNEISFEDAMGRETIHVRAERNLDELVQADHITRVGRLQRNTVGGDQVERVRGNQSSFVGGAREKTVAADEHEVTGGNHLRHVDESAELEVGGSYRVGVRQGGMLTEVEQGEYVVLSEGRVLLAQHEENSLSMVSDGADKGIFLEAKGATIHVSEDKIELRVGESSLVITSEAIRANTKVMPSGGGGGG